MSASWNGSDLQTEFSALLGDTSTAFKTKVLGWMNDIQQTICDYHDWPFMNVKGKCILESGNERQTLLMTVPTAPTAAIAAGGSLTDTSTYAVAITYYQLSTKYESKIGATSNTVTGTAANKTANITAIPVSENPLVTERRVYVSINGADWIYDQTIADNTTTTATITTESTSTVEPPDYDPIKKLDGPPFLESDAIVLRRLYKETIRRTGNVSIATGTPNWFDVIDANTLLISPKPSAAKTLSFNYYRNPNRIYATSTSQPDIIYNLKELMWMGVRWKGMAYRERDGHVGAYNLFVSAIPEYVRRVGPAADVRARVRDVVGDSDGFIDAT